MTPPDGTLILRDVDFVLTMDPPGRVLRNTSILIEGTRVKALGDYGDLRRDHGPADEELDCRGTIAVPGMVDAHTHLAMIAMRGLAADRSNVLYEIFWPVEKALTPEDTGKLAAMGALEAVKSGATLVAEHYFFAEEIALAIERVGLRGLVGHTVMTWGGPWTGERELRKSLDFIEKWSKRRSLVRPVVAPHSTETVSVEWLKLLRDVTEEKGLLIHMHLAQSRREVSSVKERTGLTPVRLLQSLRMLGPRLLAAHCLYVDEEEKLMLAASHTSVVQCPSTYMLSGEPFHAAEILEAGGRVLLGTDAPCYSDGVDMLRETRNFVYALRLLTRRSTLLTAPQVLGLATVKAAEALGLKRLGKIAMGAEADIVLLKPKLPRLRPVMEPHAAVLYSATAGDIDTVIIAGRVVVKGGRSTLVREEEVVEEGEKASRRLLKAALDLNPQLERVLPESAFKYL